MILNPEKCHYMVSGSKDPPQRLCYVKMKLLALMKENYQVFFQTASYTLKVIFALLQKSKTKINALARLRNYLTLDQGNSLINSVIKSQFIYCSLIWMSTSCYLNNALNTIHERALQLICNDDEKFFNSILTKDNQKAFTKKLGFLAIEINKFTLWNSVRKYLS